jgi:hypothetical protein
MVMAKKGKGDKNNKVRYFLFYYPSVLNSHNDNTCPRTSMSNLLIAVSERLGSQAPVFKPSHAHIIMYKPFGITRKTEKGQSGTLAPCVVATDCTTKIFTVRHAIAGFAAQQNQTIKNISPASRWVAPLFRFCAAGTRVNTKNCC